jgi:TPR repeat protein
MTKKNLARLWERTKEVAITYTGTFIVVMILNQLVFFGFCLNPICLIAAMPHVLLITVIVGSIINKIGKWGERGLAKKAKKIVGNKLELIAEAIELDVEDWKKERKEKEHSPLRSARQEQALEAMASLKKLAIAEGRYTEEDIFKLQSAVGTDQFDTVSAQIAADRAQKNFNQAKEYTEKGREKEAFKHYKIAAELGLEHAQFHLGVVYYQGRGVAKDEKEAIKWFCKAAEQGRAFAQLHLGKMYYNGQGVAQNDNEAFKWIKKAAEQGLAEAQTNLGMMYLSREGVTKDENEAAKWFRKAVAQGDPEAQRNLHEMYNDGQGVVLSDQKVVAALKKIVEDRDIEELIHFTRYENLESILKSGIVTRNSLNTLGRDFYVNDSLRLDGHQNSISLSVSFPNYKMFYKYRMQPNAKDWVVIAIKPEVLWEYKVAFCQHN